MQTHDSVALLKECCAGIQMAVRSIDEITDHVQSKTLLHILSACKQAHLVTEKEILSELQQLHAEGKSPNSMAKAMSWLKTNTMTALNKCDATIADLVTDGCNMGIKSLKRYMNRYDRANQNAKAFAERLIDLENHLLTDVAPYL